MRVDDLDYHLPEELIAAEPADQRERARLLVTRGEQIAHHHVADLPSLLTPGDVLVINTTRVLPARFFAIREATGGRVEGLFVESRGEPNWHVMLRSGGTLQPGEFLQLVTGESESRESDAEGPTASREKVGGVRGVRLVERLADGSWIVEKQSDLDTHTLLETVGLMPLPPYIRRQRQVRDADVDERSWEHQLDRQRYQTVFADEPGAVAAPTAGLHFTPQLLEQLEQAGVEVVRLTLHVGLGTFAPVRSETLEGHRMHVERFAVPAATLAALAHARHEGRRIIPVGTTCVRALESLPENPPTDRDYRGETDLLIQPGFRFRYTDGLMTNFHLPRSTLIALVAAKVGLNRLMHAYRVAIENRYRFYSYGDAMLILPE